MVYMSTNNYRYIKCGIKQRNFPLPQTHCTFYLSFGSDGDEGKKALGPTSHLNVLYCFVDLVAKVIHRCIIMKKCLEEAI